MRTLRTIAAIREDIDNIPGAVGKDEAVSIITQSIANFAIIQEDYVAIEVGKVCSKAMLGSSDHSKTLCRQG